MAKDKIADYDGATAGNNTDIGGISIAEGMLPSAVNNSMRELTRQLGAFADGTEGIDVLNLHDDDASASIKIQAPATVTTTTTFTLPDGDGTNGYALVTNGAGQLSWASAGGIANIVEDATPQLGGNLDANGNDINFGDNDKAVFGAGSELVVWSNGTNSLIQESGTGSLFIDASNLQLRNTGGTEIYFIGTSGGSTQLRYANSEKLATTSGGIDVTGTVTTDGLTVDGASVFNQAASDQSGGAAVKANGTAYGTNKSIHAYMNTSNAAKSLIYAENGAGSVFNVDGSGDISFYSSDGLSQGLYWDASAESLGLGTTSPASSVSSSQAGLHIADTNVAYLSLDNTNTNGHKYTVFSDDAGNLKIYDVDAASYRMTIDDSGKAGIGQSSPDAELHIGDGGGASDNTRLRLTGGTSGQSTIQFGDTASANIGQIQYDHSNNDLVFRVNAGTRATLDSSGNLLVGGTNTYPADNNIVGHSLTAVGQLQSSVSSYAPFVGNRKTSDGDIAVFKKDGTKVGSIGAKFSGRSYIASGSSSNTGVRFDTNFIAPADATGANRDNAINLGSSGDRFKDLYLSGGVYLGGTGSANYLDDYEEGTFTPTYQSSGGGESITYDNQVGTYTKIGRKVFFKIVLGTDAISGGSGNILIGGLPFTVVSGDNSSGYVGLLYSFSSNIAPAIWIVSGGTTTLSLYQNDNSASVWGWSNLATGGNSNRLYMVGSYNVS